MKSSYICRIIYNVIIYKCNGSRHGETRGANMRTAGESTMIRIAIVEDSEETRLELQRMISEYGKEKEMHFLFSLFSNGVNFISDYTPQYDLVFMDIDMPLLNGLETAKLLRKLDSDVGLVFVTNLGKYAIAGYDVGAIGFIVKPLNYAALSVKLQRILTKVREEAEPFLTVSSRSGLIKVALSDIYYISVDGRYVILHTKTGDIEDHKSMKQMEKELESHDFIRCDNSSMVNLKYISEINAQGAIVNGRLIPCSRNGRKALLDAFTLYLR